MFNFIVLLGAISVIATIVLLVLAIVRKISFWWVLLPVGIAGVCFVAWLALISWAMG